jgi:soluble lytic murein transglycosylase-like protein
VLAAALALCAPAAAAAQEPSQQPQQDPAQQQPPPSNEPTGGAAPPDQQAGGAQPVEGMPAVPFATEIAAAADRFGIERLLLVALVRQESNFAPDAVSRAGAGGLTQLMPGTARLMGLEVDPKRGVDERFDPERSLYGGARYLKLQLRRFRSVKLALAAYNAGPGAVVRNRGMPPSRGVRGYVRSVLAFRAQYRAGETP